MIELPRSSYYFEPLGITDEDLEIMKRMDKIYTAYPFYGYRKITQEFRHLGEVFNHKRILRLMQTMGIQALTPKMNLSKPNKDHLIFPYLLRNVSIKKNQSGLEYRYYIYPDVQKLCLSCCSNGLVQ